MPENLEYYSVLGLDSGASIADVNVQFRRMALLFHPDRNDNVEWCQEQLKRLNAAHSVLSDSEAKAAYDAQLELSSREIAPETRIRASLPAPVPSPQWSRIAVPLVFLGMVVLGVVTMIVLGFAASRDQESGNLSTVSRPVPSDVLQAPMAQTQPMPDQALPDQASDGSGQSGLDSNGASSPSPPTDDPSRRNPFVAPPDDGTVPPEVQHQEEPISPTEPSDPAAPADQSTLN